MKRIVVLLLAVVMMMSMMSVMTAGAADLKDGIAGKWEDKDSPVDDLGDQIKIKKELVSYNAISTSVYAPAFSYIYTVTPAAAGETITDEETDHNAAVAVEAPVIAGVTTGLKVNNGEAGTATSAVGTLAFTNSTVLTTSNSGGSNMYDIILDFSGVTFDKAGVYRYEITETLADTGIAVKNSGSNVRYLDVYVDGSPKIYGYVCIPTNDSVTPNTDSKTNGFVSDSNGQDEYYTYDLVLSKDVVNDTYAEANHAFPFTVIFNNSESYTTNYTITETAGTESTDISLTAGTTPAWKGVALVKDGVAITYAGIPAGVDVDVYETNDMTGTTYMVSTVVNGGGPVKDGSVSWGNAPSSAESQAATKEDYQSTKVTVDTAKYTSTDAGTTAKQTVAITNTLLQISPTGVVVRVAPYVIIMAAGIALLLIGRRRKHTAKD